MKTEPLSCDGCSMCCTLLRVEELDKPRGARCISIVDIGPRKEGCGRYATRPQSCREFECVWLTSQATAHPWPKKMRPDLSGVMFTSTPDMNAIAAHAANNEAFDRALVQKWINRWISAGLRVYLVAGDKRRPLYKQAV